MTRLPPALLALAVILLPMRSRAAGGGSGAACCCCGGAGTGGPAAAEGTAGLRAGSVYRQHYAWETDGGARLDLAALKGRPAVVALFYTTCHVACPVTVRILSEVDRSLPAASDAAIILVTLDPQTDTAFRLAECRAEHRLSERVLLLRGSESATRTLADAAGIVFRREAIRLFHVPKIVVLDRDGRVVASFPGLQVSGAEVARAALRAGAAPAAVAAAY
jgi:protein SCO1/2